MADYDQLTDAEIASELASYGENVQLPIKHNKRPILLKKLNHLRARAKAQAAPASKSRSKSNSKPAPAVTQQGRSPPPSSTFQATRSSNRRSLNSSTASAVDDERSQFNNHKFHPRPSNLETLSSDDSDVEPEPASSISSSSRQYSPTNHVNARDKRRSNQFPDVLRTLRRRTADLPPRRTQTNEVLELSTERNHFEDSINGGSEEEIPVPSPARSRLYPDLSKFTSFLSRSNEHADKFESSDSDVDSNSYEVENKSVNTSFPPSVYQDRSPNSSHSHSYIPSTSSSPSTSHFTSSSTLRHRMVPPRKTLAYGQHRVQPYKSWYLENLPQILVAVAVLFFVALSVTYIVIHKDFFFSWFSSSNNMGSGNHIILCPEEVPGREGCYGKEEIDRSLDIINLIFTQLSVKKGQVLCETAKVGDDVMLAQTFKDYIYSRSIASTNAERIYECCLDHIMANPHWNLRALKDDGSVATRRPEVAKLESVIADMSLWCRLMRSITHVVYGICLLVVVIAGVLLVSMYIKYRLRQKEIEQREVYAMVEKIIDILQDHHEQTKGEDSDEPQYLAVQHVRDQLLPPSKRRKLQPIWDKAVEFIAANESRVRLETRLIHGDEFEVWHWLQPNIHNGKVWQGQACREVKNENNSNHVIYSPTPCLKIRNMFDSSVECEDNWEDNVVDAILEKCKNIDSIVHVYVDVDSKEGCVYLKCSSCEAAGKARLSLNGWWFDGRLVTVRHLKTDHYHKRWPEARNATKPMTPSTDQMRSLSQPYYKSSIEIT